VEHHARMCGFVATRMPANSAVWCLTAAANWRNA
jgi:hypothetical protein